MEMTQQEINEIVKAISLGYTAEKIASIVDITETEVEEIQEKYATEIEDLKKWRSEQGAE